MNALSVKCEKGVHRGNDKMLCLQHWHPQNTILETSRTARPDQSGTEQSQFCTYFFSPLVVFIKNPVLAVMTKEYNQYVIF